MEKLSSAKMDQDEELSLEKKSIKLEVDEDEVKEVRLASPRDTAETDVCARFTTQTYDKLADKMVQLTKSVDKACGGGKVGPTTGQTKPPLGGHCPLGNSNCNCSYGRHEVNHHRFY